MISNRLLPCQLFVSSISKSMKFCRWVKCCLLGVLEPQPPAFLMAQNSKVPYFRSRLVISNLISLLLCTLFSASNAQGLNELPSAPTDMQSTNYSDEACNFGPEAWSTVKKHHDTKLKNLEKKARQLCLLHPNSVESKIALAKEYRGLGKDLLTVTQYDKAVLAFQKAIVLLKNIPSEKDLYRDTIEEIKGCHEKKKQRAIFLAKLKQQQTSPSLP